MSTRIKLYSFLPTLSQTKRLIANFIMVNLGSCQNLAGPSTVGLTRYLVWKFGNNSRGYDLGPHDELSMMETRLNP